MSWQKRRMKNILHLYRQLEMDGRGAFGSEDTTHDLTLPSYFFWHFQMHCGRYDSSMAWCRVGRLTNGGHRWISVQHMGHQTTPPICGQHCWYIWWMKDSVDSSVRPQWGQELVLLDALGTIWLHRRKATWVELTSPHVVGKVHLTIAIPYRLHTGINTHLLIERDFPRLALEDYDATHCFPWCRYEREACKLMVRVQ